MFNAERLKLNAERLMLFLPTVNRHPCLPAGVI